MQVGCVRQHDALVLKNRLRTRHTLSSPKVAARLLRPPQQPEHMSAAPAEQRGKARATRALSARARTPIHPVPSRCIRASGLCRLGSSATFSTSRGSGFSTLLLLLLPLSTGKLMGKAASEATRLCRGGAGCSKRNAQAWPAWAVVVGTSSTEAGAAKAHTLQPSRLARMLGRGQQPAGSAAPRLLPTGPGGHHTPSRRVCMNTATSSAGRGQRHCKPAERTCWQGGVQPNSVRGYQAVLPSYVCTVVGLQLQNNAAHVMAVVMQRHVLLQLL